MGKVFPNRFFPLFSVWSRSFRSGCFLPVMVVVFFREGVWYDWNRGFFMAAFCLCFAGTDAAHDDMPLAWIQESR